MRRDQNLTIRAHMADVSNALRILHSAIRLGQRDRVVRIADAIIDHAEGIKATALDERKEA